MAQTAILTFTDSEDGGVKVKLSFDPPVNGDAQMTPAIHMAMQALQAVNDQNGENE